MRKAFIGLVATLMLVVFDARPTWPMFLRGGGTPAPIGAITPLSAGIPDNTVNNTTVATFSCVATNGGACPPSGYQWAITAGPSFLSLDPVSGRLYTNRDLTTTDVGLPNFDSYTFLVDVVLSPTGTPVIASISWPGSPGPLNITDSTSLGTVAQFTCTMNPPTAPCTNMAWTFTGVPSFWTPGQNANGGTLTTNAAPPLPPGSGTFSVTVNPAAAFVSSIAWPGSPGALNIPDNTPLGTKYQFTCLMSDGSSCTGRTWTFTGVPAFLTSGTTATGGTVTTNTSPPLTDGSGSFQVTVP